LGQTVQSGLHHWYIFSASDYTFIKREFGFAEGYERTYPLQFADYDGDGKSDLVNLVRAFYSRTLQLTGSYVDVSLGSTGSTIRKVLPLGFSGTVVSADYDDDGKADLARYDPTNGLWTIEQSSNSVVRYESFGLQGDKIFPADYDDDGKFDVAVWRPSNGYWYWLSSHDGSFNSYHWTI
jgi:hypothetical protein